MSNELQGFTEADAQCPKEVERDKGVVEWAVLLLL